MTKTEFHRLFLQALNIAGARAEERLRRSVPRVFAIELHAPGASDQPVGVDEALERIFLGEDRFYRVIDIAVRRVLRGKSVAFVRVSGHSPAPFSQTWDPADLGPFKQIDAETIEGRDTVTG